MTLLAITQNATNWWAVLANATAVGAILVPLGWRVVSKLNTHLDEQKTLAKKFDSHAKKDRKEFKKINTRLDAISATTAATRSSQESSTQSR